MIFEMEEFNKASDIPEWLMDRPGTILFPPSVSVIKRSPNNVRFFVLVGYELHYTVTLPPHLISEVEGAP